MRFKSQESDALPTETSDIGIVRDFTAVDSRYLHVWYMIGLVDSTGRTNGITHIIKLSCVQKIRY